MSTSFNFRWDMLFCMLLYGFTVIDIEHKGLRCIFSKFSVESCTSVCLCLFSFDATRVHVFFPPCGNFLMQPPDNGLMVKARAERQAEKPTTPQTLGPATWIVDREDQIASLLGRYPCNRYIYGCI